MRKTTGLIIVLLLTPVLCFAADFNSTAGITGSSIPAGNAEIVTDEGYSDTTSLRLHVEQFGYASAVVPVEVQPGYETEVSFYIGSANSGMSFITCDVVDAGEYPNNPAFTLGTDVTPVSTGTWSEVTLSAYTYTNSTVYLRFYAYDLGQENYFWIDDVVATTGATPTPTCTPLATPTPWGCNTLMVDDFESSCDWSIDNAGAGGTITCQDGDQQLNGFYAMKFSLNEFTSSFTTDVACRSFSVIPGHRYTIRSWLYHETAGITDGAYYKIDTPTCNSCADECSTGEYVGGWTKVPFSGTTYDWYQVILEENFLVPEGRSRICISFALNGNPDQALDFWVDDLEISDQGECYPVSYFTQVNGETAAEGCDSVLWTNTGSVTANLDLRKEWTDFSDLGGQFRFLLFDSQSLAETGDADDAVQTSSWFDILSYGSSAPGAGIEDYGDHAVTDLDTTLVLSAQETYYYLAVECQDWNGKNQVYRGGFTVSETGHSYVKICYDTTAPNGADYLADADFYASYSDANLKSSPLEQSNWYPTYGYSASVYLRGNPQSSPCTQYYGYKYLFTEDSDAEVTGSGVPDILESDPIEEIPAFVDNLYTDGSRFYLRVKICDANLNYETTTRTVATFKCGAPPQVHLTTVDRHTSAQPAWFHLSSDGDAYRQSTSCEVTADVANPVNYGVGIQPEIKLIIYDEGSPDTEIYDSGWKRLENDNQTYTFHVLSSEFSGYNDSDTFHFGVKSRIWVDGTPDYYACTEDYTNSWAWGQADGGNLFSTLQMDNTPPVLASLTAYDTLAMGAEVPDDTWNSSSTGPYYVALCSDAASGLYGYSYLYTGDQDSVVDFVWPPEHLDDTSPLEADTGSDAPCSSDCEFMYYFHETISDKAGNILRLNSSVVAIDDFEDTASGWSECGGTATYSYEDTDAYLTGAQGLSIAAETPDEPAWVRAYTGLTPGLYRATYWYTASSVTDVVLYSRLSETGTCPLGLGSSDLAPSHGLAWIRCEHYLQVAGTSAYLHFKARCPGGGEGTIYIDNVQLVLVSPAHTNKYDDIKPRVKITNPDADTDDRVFLSTQGTAESPFQYGVMAIIDDVDGAPIDDWKLEYWFDADMDASDDDDGPWVTFGGKTLSGQSTYGTWPDSGAVIPNSDSVTFSGFYLLRIWARDEAGNYSDYLTSEPGTGSGSCGAAFDKNGHDANASIGFADTSVVNARVNRLPQAPEF